MLYKTRGIVLHNQAYNDKYSIIRIYTEEFGRVAYIMPQTKGKRSKVRKSLFHILSVLDLEVEHQNSREIHKIKEAKLHIPLSGLLLDPVKCSIGIFLAEFILKLAKDAQSNKHLFQFMYHSIRVLDLLEKGTANFHLVFMIQTSSFLGFFPNVEGYTNGMYFDMQSGVFVRNRPVHPHYLKENDSKTFLLLLRMNYENMHTFRFSRYERADIISRILEYYRLHLSDFPELKSLNVLQDVFE
jgi:DNA repair protein RecO (recombination protein O)